MNRVKIVGPLTFLRLLADIPTNYRKIQRGFPHIKWRTPQRFIIPSDFEYSVANCTDRRSEIIRKTAWKMFLSMVGSFDPDWNQKAIDALTRVVADDNSFCFLSEIIGTDVINDHKWFVAEKNGIDVWKDKTWLRNNIACWKEVDRLIAAFSNSQKLQCLHEYSRKHHREQAFAAVHWLQSEFLKRNLP